MSRPSWRSKLLLTYSSWLLGPNWPVSGELDVIENVNSASTNEITLHTNQGCSISNSSVSSGTVVQSNCDIVATNNQGCSVHTSDSATFGETFNANQGGIYTTEWTSDAINVWFFPRGNLPLDIGLGKPDPTGWDTPLARFAGSCDIDEHIMNQQIESDLFTSILPLLIKS